MDGVAHQHPANESKDFFFEKKKQKTFARGRARCDWRGPQM
jgi:hypothetical protein